MIPKHITDTLTYGPETPFPRDDYYVRSTDPHVELDMFLWAVLGKVLPARKPKAAPLGWNTSPVQSRMLGGVGQGS